MDSLRSFIELQKHCKFYTGYSATDRKNNYIADTCSIRDARSNYTIENNGYCMNISTCPIYKCLLEIPLVDILSIEILENKSSRTVGTNTSRPADIIILPDPPMETMKELGPIFGRIDKTLPPEPEPPKITYMYEGFTKKDGSPLFKRKGKHYDR